MRRSLASAPTKTSPLAKKETTDGIKADACDPLSTRTLCSSATATTELVVPKSMPTTILIPSDFHNNRSAQRSHVFTSQPLFSAFGGIGRAIFFVLFVANHRFDIDNALAFIEPNHAHPLRIAAAFANFSNARADYLAAIGDDHH